jgi:N4-gp56 family major capsid protein
MAAAVTAVANVTELVPEITLAVDYIYQDKSLGRALAYYQDVSAQPGIIVEFPRFTEVAGSTAPAEGTAPTSHAMDLTMPYLTLALRSVYVQLGDLAKKGASGNLIEQVSSAIGMAMVKQIDARIFGVVTATTNWTTGTGATNAALSLTHIQDGLNLLEKNEVDDQIFGVVHPHQWKSIRAIFAPVTSATNALSIGAVQIGNVVSDTILTAGMGNFYGIDWFKSNRIGSGTVTATASVYNGLLFARRGIGYGFSYLVENGIEVQRQAAGAYDHVVMNWADSAGVTYDSAVCKLYSTSS